MKIFVAIVFAYVLIGWATETWMMRSYAGCHGTMRPCAEQNDIVVTSLVWPAYWYVESALLIGGRE